MHITGWLVSDVWRGSRRAGPTSHAHFPFQAQGLHSTTLAASPAKPRDVPPAAESPATPRDVAAAASLSPARRGRAGSKDA
jgi:hypothetical protein